MRRQDRVENIAFRIFVTGDVLSALAKYGAWCGNPNAVLEGVRKGYRAGAGDATNEIKFAAYNIGGMIRFPDDLAALQQRISEELAAERAKR